MASIYQSIEILSKEKGIDPQIVLDAVKDAMLAAARKHFRSQEDLVADLDEKTGNIQICAVKQVVEAVQDPNKEITLSAAKKISSSAAVGARSTNPSRPKRWAGSPPRPPSRSSFKRFVRPSATVSSPNSRGGRESWSTAS